MDVLRKLRALIGPLREPGNSGEPALIPSLKEESIALDRIFTYVFVANDAYYANTDFAQYSIVELPGFKKWSEWSEERFKGY